MEAPQLVRKINTFKKNCQVLENVVNEIRDPIEEADSQEVLNRRQMLADKLQTEYDLRENARKAKNIAIADEEFDRAKTASNNIDRCTTHISIIEEELEKLQRDDPGTWKRALYIIADMLEFTKKPIIHPFLHPLLETTISIAVKHQDQGSRNVQKF